MNSQSDMQRNGSDEKFFYGFVIVATTFLIMMLAGGSLYTFGIFLKPLLREFGWSRTALSGAFSLQAVLTAVFFIISGRLNDKLGPRIMVTIAGVSFGLCFFLMSKVSAVFHVYIYFGILFALGMSCCYVPLLSTVAKWFIEKRGLMTGIGIAGAGIGTMFLPYFVSIIVEKYGWRTSYAAMGLLLFLGIVLLAQLLRRDPEQMGLLPYGGSASLEDSSHAVTEGFSLPQAMRTRQFWMVGTAYLMQGIFLMAIMVHIVPHAIELGISATTAAKIISVIGGMSLFGRIAMGSVSDRIGDRKTLVICFLLMTAALGWLLISKNMSMFYLFAAVFGFFYGGTISLKPVVVANFFGLSSHGLIFGVISFCTTVGGAIGPILAGYLFETAGSYTVAFSFCCGFSALGLICVSFLSPIKKSREAAS